MTQTACKPKSIYSANKNPQNLIVYTGIYSCVFIIQRCVFLFPYPANEHFEFI